MSTRHQHSTDIGDHPTRNTKPKPPCAEHPDDWDLDVGNPETWRSAVAICHSCPLFSQCAELATTLNEHGMPPRSMIWAGIGYDGSGSAIEDLDRHRAGPVEYRRPLVIVRTGPQYGRTHSSDPAAAPIRYHEPDAAGLRRTIILRRRGALPDANVEGR